MNLENVFYGFTKDGKPRLLWNKFRTIYTSIDAVSTVVYYDLEEKCEFNLSNVDTETLKPITDIVGNKKWMRRKKVTMAYNADMNMLIDVKNAFYGDILNKRVINNVYIVSNNLKKDILFAQVESLKERFMDVKTRSLYPSSENVIKGKCVKKIRPIRTEQFDDVVAPKRKLLELDYRKEL